MLDSLHGSSAAPNKLKSAPHWLYYLLFVASTLIAVLLSVNNSYDNHLREAKYQTQQSASAGAELISRLIDNVNLLFPGIQDLLQRLPADDRYREQIRTVLLARQQENPYLMDLLVVDPTGKIDHWTGDGTPPSITDRAYVSAHLGEPQPDDLYVGQPKLSKVHIGEWFFAISRAQRSADGQLQSILVAIIDIAYIRDALRAIDRPAEGTLILASDSGIIYSRVPNHQLMVGREVPLIAEAASNAVGSFSDLVISPLDDRQRAYTLQRSRTPQLVFISSVALDHYLADWYRTLWQTLLALAAVLALIGWMTQRLHCSHRDLLQLSTYDSLSGNYNRATFVRMANAELARVRRYPTALSLLMLDLDNFKQINDRYGHAAGDRVIQGVGALLREITRDSDVSCRCGGEEFVLLLPQTSAAGAEELAEKIRQGICESKLLPDGAAFELSASIGVAELLQGESLEDIFSRADAALYRSKQSGKNCVTLAS